MLDRKGTRRQVEDEVELGQYPIRRWEMGPLVNSEVTGLSKARRADRAFEGFELCMMGVYMSLEVEFRIVRFCAANSHAAVESDQVFWH